MSIKLQMLGREGQASTQAACFPRAPPLPAPCVCAYVCAQENPHAFPVADRPASTWPGVPALRSRGWAGARPTEQGQWRGKGGGAWASEQGWVWEKKEEEEELASGSWDVIFDATLDKSFPSQLLPGSPHLLTSGWREMMTSDW